MYRSAKIPNVRLGWWLIGGYDARDTFCKVHVNSLNGHHEHEVNSSKNGRRLDAPPINGPESLGFGLARGGVQTPGQQVVASVC